MPPTVLIYSERQHHADVFVSLEKMPLVLADVRKALPHLEKELRTKWPIEHVEIENRKSHLRKNPYDPSQIIPAACVGLAITFAWATAKAAGKQFGDGIGKEITKYVLRRVRSLSQEKPTGRIGQKKRRRVSLPTNSRGTRLAKAGRQK